MKQWVIWCDLNAEQDALEKAFGNKCVSIKGSQSMEEKERLLEIWLNKEVPVLISKPSIIGFGLNLQQCSNTAYLGLSDSFEMLFQSTKRFHRHGQKNDVHRHLIVSEAEGSVIENVKRKERDFMRMIGEMVQHTKKINTDEIHGAARQKQTYSETSSIIIPSWLKTEEMA